MKVALDTNLLVYAEGLNGLARQKTTLDLIDALPRGMVVLPAQVASELFQVLVRKAQWSASKARSAMLAWCDAFTLAESSRSVLFGAAELAVVHRFSFWDGLVLASAAEAACRLLLSEDLQHGFIWNSVTIINPFTTPRDPVLESFLGQP